MGSVVELSTDHFFMTSASSGQFKYQWSRIINDEEEKIEDEECFKNSNSNTLVINDFEGKYAGTYRCVISTSSQPIISMTAEVELHLPGRYKHSIAFSSRAIVISYCLQIFLKILALK